MSPNPAISFSLSSSLPPARLGTLTLLRNDTSIIVQTPGILTAASRGVVPHLTRDHCQQTQAIKLINIPFETFLENKIPVPTLISKLNIPNPLHSFLGYDPDQHILSMSVRDPHDGREMPANGQMFITAHCVQGVRKITPTEWKKYASACSPDFTVAMSDNPYNKLPLSQKRLTKSIERSASWLFDFLRGGSTSSVLVQMAGGSNTQARVAFAQSLTEPLSGRDADAIQPLTSLDEGVFGYVFDFLSLYQELCLESQNNSAKPVTHYPIQMPNTICPLVNASLAPLPSSKIRIVNSVQSPHDMLYLIRDVGVDIFDIHWAQRAANIGVALDFSFPICPRILSTHTTKKRDIGHNLYSTRYNSDFSALSDDFAGFAGLTDTDYAKDSKICHCKACSPTTGINKVLHSSIDEHPGTQRYLPPFSRAYIHHLLHTHEMSAYTLLAMHNITVVDTFLSGVRSAMANPEEFLVEISKFEEEFDDTLAILDGAWVTWQDVELTRGKGRIARERGKNKKDDHV